MKNTNCIFRLEFMSEGPEVHTSHVNVQRGIEELIFSEGTVAEYVKPDRVKTKDGTPFAVKKSQPSLNWSSEEQWSLYCSLVRNSEHALAFRRMKTGFLLTFRISV